MVRSNNGMRKPSITIGLTVVFVAGFLFVFLHAREPRYQGRTLTSWLEQCSDTPLMETQRLTEAQEAVRAIGTQKALPKLLKLVEAKDDLVSTWIIAKSEKFRIRFFHWRSTLDFQLQGIAGFEVLGTNAAPAVGELTKLLNDKELAFVAARCLENIGKPAESALCQCLANGDWHVRHLSVSALASVTDDVEVYLARVKDRLKDTEPSVRFATVQAVGEQNNAPELAVPLLIAALEDADDAVSSQAASALSGFGTNAASAFSTLTNLLNGSRQTQTRAALKALAAIAPAQALPVLSNAVVNGSSTTLGAALKNLKAIAPELGLQMTLAQFHSPDSRRRLRAVSVVTDYDVATPGIADALKSAAADPDPEIAKRAVMTMMEMLRKQKETKGGYVQMSNEPSYQGKTLGEWLKMGKEGWELSTNAVEALRQMGTNVIPALVARVAYREPVFNLYDYDTSMEAVGALISLRERAKPALPALTALMDSDDQDPALHAMLATCGMGTNAIPCLIKGLTNRFPIVRGEAANYLTQGVLGVPSSEQRKQAIPLLIKLLNDPDENVRRNATNELKVLDPKAAAEAGIK
jgi:HEAT repeat protein